MLNLGIANIDVLLGLTPRLFGLGHFLNGEED